MTFRLLDKFIVVQLPWATMIFLHTPIPKGGLVWSSRQAFVGFWLVLVLSLVSLVGVGLSDSGR